MGVHVYAVKGVIKTWTMQYPGFFGPGPAGEQPEGRQKRMLTEFLGLVKLLQDIDSTILKPLKTSFERIMKYGFDDIRVDCSNVLYCAFGSALLNAVRENRQQLAVGEKVPDSAAMLNYLLSDRDHGLVQRAAQQLQHEWSYVRVMNLVSLLLPNAKRVQFVMDAVKKENVELLQKHRPAFSLTSRARKKIFKYLKNPACNRGLKQAAIGSVSRLLFAHEDGRQFAMDMLSEALREAQGRGKFELAQCFEGDFLLQDYGEELLPEGLADDSNILVLSNDSDCSTSALRVRRAVGKGGVLIQAFFSSSAHLQLRWPLGALSGLVKLMSPESDGGLSIDDMTIVVPRNSRRPVNITEKQRRLLFLLTTLGMTGDYKVSRDVPPSTLLADSRGTLPWNTFRRVLQHKPAQQSTPTRLTYGTIQTAARSMGDKNLSFIKACKRLEAALATEKCREQLEYACSSKLAMMLACIAPSRRQPFIEVVKGFFDWQPAAGDGKYLSCLNRLPLMAAVRVQIGNTNRKAAPPVARTTTIAARTTISGAHTTTIAARTTTTRGKSNHEPKVRLATTNMYQVLPVEDVTAGQQKQAGDSSSRSRNNIEKMKELVADLFKEGALTTSPSLPKSVKTPVVVLVCSAGRKSVTSESGLGNCLARYVLRSGLPNDGDNVFCRSSPASMLELLLNLPKLAVPVVVLLDSANSEKVKKEVIEQLAGRADVKVCPDALPVGTDFDKALFGSQANGLLWSMSRVMCWLAQHKQPEQPARVDQCALKLYQTILSWIPVRLQGPVSKALPEFVRMRKSANAGANLLPTSGDTKGLSVGADRDRNKKPRDDDSKPTITGASTRVGIPLATVLNGEFGTAVKANFGEKAWRELPALLESRLRQVLQASNLLHLVCDVILMFCAIRAPTAAKPVEVGTLVATLRSVLMDDKKDHTIMLDAVDSKAVKEFVRKAASQWGEAVKLLRKPGYSWIYATVATGRAGRLDVPVRLQTLNGLRKLLYLRSHGASSNAVVALSFCFGFAGSATGDGEVKKAFCKLVEGSASGSQATSEEEDKEAAEEAEAIQLSEETFDVAEVSKKSLQGLRTLSDDARKAVLEAGLSLRAEMAPFRKQLPGGGKTADGPLQQGVREWKELVRVGGLVMPKKKKKETSTIQDATTEQQQHECLGVLYRLRRAVFEAIIEEQSKNSLLVCHPRVSPLTNKVQPLLLQASTFSVRFRQDLLGPLRDDAEKKLCPELQKQGYDDENGQWKDFWKQFETLSSVFNIPGSDSADSVPDPDSVKDDPSPKVNGVHYSGGSTFSTLTLKHTKEVVWKAIKGQEKKGLPLGQIVGDAKERGTAKDLATAKYCQRSHHGSLRHTHVPLAKQRGQMYEGTFKGNLNRLEANCLPLVVDSPPIVSQAATNETQSMRVCDDDDDDDAAPPSARQPRALPSSSSSASMQDVGHSHAKRKLPADAPPPRPSRLKQARTTTTSTSTSHAKRKLPADAPPPTPSRLKQARTTSTSTSTSTSRCTDPGIGFSMEVPVPHAPRSEIEPLMEHLRQHPVVALDLGLRYVYSAVLTVVRSYELVFDADGVSGVKMTLAYQQRRLKGKVWRTVPHHHPQQPQQPQQQDSSHHHPAIPVGHLSFYETILSTPFRNGSPDDQGKAVKTMLRTNGQGVGGDFQAHLNEMLDKEKIRTRERLRRHQRKLAMDLVYAIDTFSTGKGDPWVVIGDGKPNGGRGHAQIQFDILTNTLAGFFPVVIVDEFNTSKTCHCHGAEVAAVRGAYRSKRCTAASVKCYFDRDTAGAWNMLNIFHANTLFGARPNALTRWPPKRG